MALRTSIAAVFVTLAVSVSADGVKARVDLSDGRTLEGVLATPGGKALRLRDIEHNKWVRVPLQDLALIEVRNVKTEMLEAWRWKEASKPEKVYLGKKYPRLHFEVHATLINGKKIRAHASSQLLLTDEHGDVERVFLLRYMKGKAGEKPSDLVWTRRITFPDAKVNVRRRRIRGALRPAGAVREVWALRHKVAEIYHGKVVADSEEQDSYIFDDLVPAVYDLCLLTDRQLIVYLGLAGEGVKDDLSDADRRAIAKKISDLEEFHTRKEMMFATGSVELAKALFRKTRKEKTTLEKEDDEQLMFLAFEVVYLKKVEDRWEVLKRVHIWRDRFPLHAEKDNMREVVLLRKLADLDLRGKDEVRRDVDLEVK